tara:strand:- start:6392 stop:7306 length:915 start_codon:yes stop_codon:yes gene_type:complete
MRLNLNLTRIFYTVVRENSFSRAASALCISQPAVSRAVRELESQLDQTLFERGSGAVTKSGRLRMTASGQVLFDYAREIFALEQAAAKELADRACATRGMLVVGASTTVAGYWLPSLLAKYHQSHPGVLIKVVVANTEAICADLRDYQLDLAIIEGAVEDPLITEEKVFAETLSIVAPPDFKLSADEYFAQSELNRAVWLFREPGSGTRTVTQTLLAEQQIKPTEIIEFGSNEGIAQAVCHGLGIAMLPDVVTAGLIELGRIKLLSPDFLPVFERDLRLLKRQGRIPSPAAEYFFDLIRSAVQA